MERAYNSSSNKERMKRALLGSKYVVIRRWKEHTIAVRTRKDEKSTPW